MMSDGDWIFVHIQKTAGTSIRSALGVDLHDARKHFTAQELRRAYGDAAWQRCFKFGFVRNPWDRLVSWWSMIDANRDLVPPNGFFRYVLENARTFEEFIDRCTDEISDSDGGKSLLRNQIDYLTDGDGKIIVDFIGRFEQMQTDFDVVCRHIGRAKLDLPRTNASRHASYVEFYTPGMVDTVADRFARDIAAFGYRFGE